MWLPYLFIRAYPGDTGARPAQGVWWESPDVYILSGVAPAAAPDVPAQLGQVALAGQDNTVYGHVWNLGRGPRVRSPSSSTGAIRRSASIPWART